MTRRADGRVRLLTRKGINFASRFPQVVAALTVLPMRSCLIDGEAVVCNESGLAVFDLIRGYRHDAAAVLCAFDLLELDGEDLRRTPIEERKRILARLLSRPQAGIAFNQHYLCDGAILFKHARALGCEGIVSKRLGSHYRSGRADCWIKVKNPNPSPQKHRHNHRPLALADARPRNSRYGFPDLSHQIPGKRRQRTRFA
jgi:bifunctional non-homologous end joining protein LigD